MIGGETLMPEYLNMSTKEIDRVSVMKELVSKEIKAKRAAEILGLSVRQVKRIKKRFVQEGKFGLVHRSRGRISNHRTPPAETTRVLAVIREKYSDFGPTLALEKLKEGHGVTLSRETLRKVMIEGQVWKPKKKRALVIHQTRRRREREGELVQMDGSPHKWFEERGPYCTLLVMIDDATGKLKHLRFVPAETTAAYFEAVGDYLTLYGKPMAFYVDKHGVFRVNTQKEGACSVTDSTGLTQFGRAMTELSIGLIFAGSPQAKGRVEKANETLQDRLVKEMRLRAISTIEEGNAYLPQFQTEFNYRFAIDPLNPVDAHRPLLSSEHPEKILLVKETRRLSKNLEFCYGNKLYQVQTNRPAYALRHAPVTVTEDRDGAVMAYYRFQRLEIAVAERLPNLRVVDAKEIYREVEKVIRTPLIPAENHPWRRSFI